MTIYETIRAAISVKQAAEQYGLKAGCNGMACCSFHNDRHPRLKLNEEYFISILKNDLIDRCIHFCKHERIQNKTGVAPLTLRHSA